MFYRGTALRTVVVAALVMRPEEFRLLTASKWFFGFAVGCFTIGVSLGPSRASLSAIKNPALTGGIGSRGRRYGQQVIYCSPDDGLLRLGWKASPPQVNQRRGTCWRVLAAEIANVGLVAVGIVAFFVWVRLIEQSGWEETHRVVRAT